MKHSLKIAAISLAFGLSVVSVMALERPAQSDLIKGFELKPSIDKEIAMLRRRPRIPGGSGCDDPHDIIEHPECRPGGVTRLNSQVSSVEVYPNGNVEIRYANGWKEALENGRYELKNANNRTVIERRATAADMARINGLARR